MNKIIRERRFIIMNIAVLAIVISSLVYVVVVGNEYDIHSRFYYDEETDRDIQVSFSEEGVIEYTGAHMKDGELIFSVKSIAEGKTDVVFTVTSPSGITPQYRTTLTVNPIGTIFEHSELLFSFKGYDVVVTHIIIALIVILIVMIVSFLELQKKAKYSYPMIAAGGIALFNAILIAFLVYKMLNHAVTSFSVFTALVSETGKQFLLAMTPFMAVLAVALSVSNIWLMRHEGYRPVNALGIAFSIVWFLGMAGSFGFFYFRFLSIENYELASNLNKALIYLCCYFECMLLSTIVSAYSASRHKPPYDRDCIIILGCAIRADGSPTPLLRMRTDSAIKFEEEQFSKTGKHALFVPSGGQGSDEVISEAESMRRYLVSQDIPDDQIAMESRSTSTNENMQYSKAVIEEQCGDIREKKIAFATTNYHIFRGYILAQKNGFVAQGISAKTKWYFFPNAFLREFIGLLVDKKLWHLMQIIIFITIFIGVGRLL